LKKPELEIFILLQGVSFESNRNLKDDIIPLFEKLFSVERINLNQVLCGFEDEMTVFDLAVYKMWDKEYISRRYNK